MQPSAEQGRKKKLITCIFCTVLDTSDTYPTSASQTHAFPSKTPFKYQTSVLAKAET